MVQSGSRVYVGGDFTGGVAALDASTGALVWTASVNGGVRALAMSSDGSHVIAGGTFTAADGVTHRKLVSLQTSDGSPQPKWKAAAGGAVRDIVVVGDTAYFGGTFSQHAGIAQRGLGAVSVSTGKVVPDFDAATDGNVYSLATNGSRLFVGGKFTHVNGQPRDTMASVTLSSNTLDGWAPARGCSNCNVVWDLLVNGSTVYTVGRNAAAVTAVDSLTAVRRWRVTANGDAQALAFADGSLYVGGHFAAIGGQTHQILAALNATTGTVDPGFTPTFVKSYPGIWAMTATSSRLYVGGYFTRAGAKRGQYPYFAMYGG